MKYLNLIFILVSLLFFWESNARLINEIFTYQRNENIDGTDFIYNKKVANGKKEVSWFIDNEEVSKEEYAKTLLKFKQREWEAELEKEDENELQEEEFKVEMQIGVVKKILYIKIKEIDEALKKIKELKDYDLMNYFVFNENTFRSQYDLDILERSLIPEIRKYLEKAYDKITLFDLNNYLEKIDTCSSKLNIFFKNTINNAIKLCDDTKLLRKLLELIN